MNLLMFLEITEMSKIKDNPVDQINPSFNDLLTKYCNDNIGWKPTPTELTFLKDCYKINTIGKEYVTRLDFPSFSMGKFKNLAFRLSFCLIKVINSRPPQYLLDGISIGNVTIKNTKLGKIKQDFEKEILRLKIQPPFIHDIKLTVKTSELYDKLASNGHKINKSNKGITVKDLPLNSKISANVTVYPNGTLLIHLGCTYHPIQYSTQGWLEVNAVCSKIESLLQSLANHAFICQPTYDWLVTTYHFNKDGVIIDDPIHHYSIARLSEHSQIYTKKLENDQFVLRYEEKAIPNKTIKELQDNLPDEEQYSISFERASKMYDD